MEILKISHELIGDDILEQNITVALEFTAMDGKISLEHHPVLLLTSVLIAKAGARLLFLPPYSPDLNAIEQTFSKIKHVLRKSMGRSVRAIENAIAGTLPAISASECQNYFRNAGYASY